MILVKTMNQLCVHTASQQFTGVVEIYIKLTAATGISTSLVYIPEKKRKLLFFYHYKTNLTDLQVRLYM